MRPQSYINILYIHTKVNLSIVELDKLLPTLYWLPKMHKITIGARFKVALKKGSTKRLSDTIFKIFKALFNAVESSHNKSLFYSWCKKSLVAQFFFPIVTKLNKNNIKKNVKFVSPFGFSSLHTTIPQKPLLKIFSEVVNFHFKYEVRKPIRFV